MKFSTALLGAVVLTGGVVTGAALDGQGAVALQQRQIVNVVGKDKVTAPGDDRADIYQPVGDASIACSMISVRESGLANAIRGAIESYPIGRPFAAYNIPSEVYENEFVYYGKVHFNVRWVPSDTFSFHACPTGNMASLFDMMLAEHDMSCSSATQLGPFDFPRTLRQEYNDCGTLEVFHVDSISTYNDFLVGPGLLVCGGKDKLFGIETVKPFIRTFCRDFTKKPGVVGDKAKMLHKHSNVKYESGPFSTVSLDMVKTSNLNIFAAFDKNGCGGDASKQEWPSEAKCIANLEAAMNASGNVGMCKRECNLTADRDGELELGYCDEFHDPTTDKTQGGYTWSDCFRWGVIDDLEEGVLGHIMKDQERAE